MIKDVAVFRPREEKVEKPEVFPVARAALDKILTKAYNISKEPMPFYPTVEELDDLVESEQFLFDPWVREESFKMFVLCILNGFTRDKLWHKENPGKRHVTIQNLYDYLVTPCISEDAYIPHTGAWKDSAGDEEKEDRQAAFEYMQSLILDESYYTIVDNRKKKSAIA